MLSIKNLHVEVGGKEILKGVSLKINEGEKHAIMGENGSGKSSLVLAIAGHPNYKITSGEIIFQGKNVLDLDASERARLGMFLSMQNPPEIEGVRLSRLMMESQRVLGGSMNIIELNKNLNEKFNEFGFDENALNRSVNLGFSGGEKKKTEIIQMSLLNPSFILLDEVDSGLDIDSLRKISLTINNYFDKNKSLLLITHYKRILEYIEPDFVHIMIDGKIVKSGKKELVDEIEEKGYMGLKEVKN